MAKASEEEEKKKDALRFVSRYFIMFTNKNSFKMHKQVLSLKLH